MIIESNVIAFQKWLDHMNKIDTKFHLIEIKLTLWQRYQFSYVPKYCLVLELVYLLGRSQSEIMSQEHLACYTISNFAMYSLPLADAATWCPVQFMHWLKSQ